MADNYKPLPPALTRHASLTDAERAYFTDLSHDELSVSQRRDMLVLLEAVLAERVPDFRHLYTQRHESAATATRGLCANLLGPRGVSEPQKTLGFNWLMQPHPANALLAFYFRLRALKAGQELITARQRQQSPTQ